jgi:hypothetical protein
MIETEVLIIGSGPAGATTALLLSTYGIKNIVVTKYRWLAETPRAHITNQRALEVFRDMGVEEDVKRLATRQEWMGNTVFCTALAGEELGRIQTWGTRRTCWSPSCSAPPANAAPARASTSNISPMCRTMQASPPPFAIG